MNMKEILYNYNTEISNNKRCDMAEAVEEIFVSIESVSNMLRGMQFDKNISSAAKQAMTKKIAELDDILSRYSEN